MDEPLSRLAQRVKTTDTKFTSDFRQVEKLGSVLQKMLKREKRKEKSPFEQND